MIRVAQLIVGFWAFVWAAEIPGRQSATVDDAVQAFQAFYAAVAERHGEVRVEAMLDAMNAADFGAKTVERIRGWDSDADGKISRDEGSAGVRADILAIVDDQMKSDADGDGKLSAEEYALAVPDRRAAKTPDGFTQRQQAMFASADIDKDNFYSRAEALTANAYRQYHGYLGRAAAYRARRFDLDGDRRYNLREFALIYGVRADEPIPDAVREKFEGKAFGAGNHTYYNVMMRIIHMPPAEIEAVNARAAAFAEPTAVSTFLRIFDLLAQGEGSVPLAVLFDELNLQEGEARQVKATRSLDRNADGKVTREEAIAGVKALLKYQTDRGMNTDADGDDALTPQEYALSYADPNGKPGPEGLTVDQWKGFREADGNGDGQITRSEIASRVDRSYETSYWIQWMALRARQADRNGDGRIDADEFASLEGFPSAGSLSGAARKRFGAAADKKGSVPVRWSVRLFPYNMASGESRAALEKSMDEFEKRMGPESRARGESK
jgi:Ca2+-binding EF-hand superfamily protein